MQFDSSLIARRFEAVWHATEGIPYRIGIIFSALPILALFGLQIEARKWNGKKMA